MGSTEPKSVSRVKSEDAGAGMLTHQVFPHQLTLFASSLQRGSVQSQRMRSEGAAAQTAEPGRLEPPGRSLTKSSSWGSAPPWPWRGLCSSDPGQKPVSAVN